MALVETGVYVFEGEGVGGGSGMETSRSTR